MLLVRACSRSSAPSRSVEGSSVDQRLPTSRTSPDASSWRSRRNVFVWFSPAALAILPVECSPRASSRRAFFTRSSRSAGGRSCRGGAGGAAGGGAASRLSGTGGAFPWRARHAAHMTTGWPPSGRTTSSSRQRRPERQIAQRRPARSISVMSSALTDLTAPHDRRSASTATSRHRADARVRCPVPHARPKKRIISAEASGPCGSV